ncbi:ethanolamine utilization protein EutN [Candidatus Heimdallarchaeota archaeon B3_Heim]|nr:MAG: ethanolamine utilization protein EutN [Candidatus Heimdallarchaeota archaeon B3_Heim]
MKVCKVIGNVVSTEKDEGIKGFKLLIVEPVDMVDLKPESAPFVAIDAVGAGEDEVVLVVTGSSSRLTAMTKDRPTDATIQAIIDFIQIKGKETYRK